jgi:hypothetical protein
MVVRSYSEIAICINVIEVYGLVTMKKVLITAVTAILIGSGITPASAVDYPLPTWAAETGAAKDFTWANWLPCSAEFKTTDCIDSVYWVKTDGTRVLGKWVIQPGATYENFKQTWVMQSNGESAQYFNEPVSQFGHYTFEGLLTPCNDNIIVMDFRPVRGSFQLNASPFCSSFFKSKFEERFEMTVKSKSLKGFVGGIASNGKDPEINFVEKDGQQLLTVKANFAYIAWNNIFENGIAVNVCEKNEYRAKDGGWGLWNSVYWSKMMNDPLLAVNPGDMIAGTNGWNCGGNMSWDSQEQALVMYVGSPHFDVDGTVIDGWYEGAIRGRYITSRFGIKPQQAAGSARLEIVYSDGQRKVATITSKYDSATDWLYLKGYGFTYSTPKLMVKFDKPAEVVEVIPAAPVAEVKPVATVAVKKSITCIKGKTTKTVTAVKPVCPTGYKKKV